MNLFDFHNATDEQLTELGFDGSAAMFAEGAELAGTSLEVSLEALQDFLTALVSDGALSAEQVMELAGLEQDVFKCIHSMTILTTMTKVVEGFAKLMDKYKDEADQSAKEGA